MTSVKNIYQKARALRRKVELFKNHFEVLESEADVEQLLNTDSEKINIIFRFLVRPVSFEKDKKGFVKSITLKRQKLEGEHYKQTAIDDPEAKNLLTYSNDLIFRCIGYKGYCIDKKNLPFDYVKGIIPNSNGCMLTGVDSEYSHVGKYVAGWIRQGPIGVIDTTLKGSEETWVNMRRHLENEKLPLKVDPYDSIATNFKEQRVSFKDWERVDKHEIEEGKKIGMCRVKMNDNGLIRELINN